VAENPDERRDVPARAVDLLRAAGVEEASPEEYAERADASVDVSPRDVLDGDDA
jgi:hypothetical protein